MKIVLLANKEQKEELIAREQGNICRINLVR